MTPADAIEYSRMVKALDTVAKSMPASLWPLCAPAVAILEYVEREVRYTCPMCKSVINGHSCNCPISGAQKGLRARRERERGRVKS